MKSRGSSDDRLISYAFHEIGRLPAPGDNVAIAGRKLAAGTRISYGDDQFSLDFTVLEGHRFAIRPILTGEPLLSWGLPFGIAIRPIAPGNYVSNDLMIEALQGRTIDFDIPQQPNFRDEIKSYTLDEILFCPGTQVTPHADTRYFMGYRRHSKRGVGTRNMIVILGTTSRAASYARLLESRLHSTTADFPNVDGIVAISHTEGSGGKTLNNRDLLLRTLSGLVIHPNCGAVLTVDAGPDQITNEHLRQYMIDNNYPLDGVIHHFLTLEGDFQADLAAGESIIRNWLDVINGMSRTHESLSHLNIGLQCGGSDAFSGVSGNPLAGSVAREIVRYGGRANLAETDELVGAETYILQNIRDLDTAVTFLGFIAQFKERLSWHGVTAEGNPSGGNRYRGLYNVVLKSIGAAMKRHPEVRLDYAVDYAQPMEQPGFYFMNTPGNDLESIAGQVAGGSNMVLFVTGNGSITNFPLVPTIKIMTTSGRYEMLANDMDVNAGAYQDGVPMESLTQETLDLTIAVASGQPSVGERAGHAQVSIWRNWRQTDTSRVAQLLEDPKPSGQPIPISMENLIENELNFQAIKSDRGYVADQVGLILPTSICSGQIARMSAATLNQLNLGRPNQLSRFVSLAHTEGCGVAVRSSGDVYDQTMISYMTHPFVRFGLFLEHGCEKTHNDYMRLLLEKRGVDPGRFGWASIQLDGGIERVLSKMETWFRDALSTAEDPVYESVGLEYLSLGLLSVDPIPDPIARSLSQITRTIVGAGGTVVVPRSTSLLDSAIYQENTSLDHPVSPSLAYGQFAQESGFHVMETQSEHWVETMTGLGATGVQLMLAFVDGRPMQAHPFIPLLQITTESASNQRSTKDFDLLLTGDAHHWAEDIIHLVTQVASRAYQPKLAALGNVDFQITRGLLGIST